MKEPTLNQNTQGKNIRIPSTERHVYRDSYSSRGSQYIEDSSRTVSRVPSRNSHLYDDDDDDGGRYMYVDHPSRYNDGGTGTRNFSSSLKRPYSSIEDHHPRYESSRRQSRSDFDYGNDSDLVYNDRIYGNEPTRVARGSRSGYNGSSQSNNGGYRRVDISADDPEEMYPRFGRERESRDYIPSRSAMRGESYSPVYSSHRVADDYTGGRVSDSYY